MFIKLSESALTPISLMSKNALKLWLFLCFKSDHRTNMVLLDEMTKRQIGEFMQLNQGTIDNLYSELKKKKFISKYNSVVLIPFNLCSKSSRTRDYHNYNELNPTSPWLTEDSLFAKSTKQ